MVKLFIKFPKTEGSSIFDGKKHEAEVIDLVKVGKSNVYILDFNDQSLGKRSRIFVQKGKIQITHLPVKDKRGLNDLFNQLKPASPKIDIEEFFRTDKDLGCSEPYDNVETIKNLVQPPKKEAHYTEFDFNLNDKKELGPEEIHIVESYTDKVAREAMSATYEEAPDEPNNVSDDKGILGFWGMTESAVGPGENGSYKRPYMLVGNPSTSNADLDDHPDFPPPPPPPEDGPHGPRR